MMLVLLDLLLKLKNYERKSRRPQMVKTLPKII